MTQDLRQAALLADKLLELADKYAQEYKRELGWAEDARATLKKELRAALANLTAADMPAVSGSDVPARPTSLAGDALDYRDAARRLWMLLDDIDTLDDACRSNDADFRRCARETQRKRFAILSGEHFDALSASPPLPQEQGAVQQWMPIETAPENVEVLALEGSLRNRVVAIKRPESYSPSGWCYPGASGRYYQPNRGLTHWTYLPPVADPRQAQMGETK